MGWLKAKQPARLACSSVSESDYIRRAGTTEHFETLDPSNVEYPICSKSVQDKDLISIPAQDVRSRDGKNSSRLWIVIDDVVYDCSSFVDVHPGGDTVIKSFGGKCCSWQFWRFHSPKVMKEYGLALRVGKTEGVENPYEEVKTYVGLRPLGVDYW